MPFIKFCAAVAVEFIMQLPYASPHISIMKNTWWKQNSKKDKNTEHIYL